MRFSDDKELIETIEKNDDVVTCPMVLLRDWYGADRLGIHVVRGISDRLDRLGIGHQPETLPQNKDAIVRLFRKGAEVGRLLRSFSSIDDESTQLLREIAKKSDSNIVRQIRELVCG